MACLKNWAIPRKSKTITWSASGGNGNADIPTDFLAGFVRSMSAAMIVGWDIRYRMSITVQAGEVAMSRIFPAVFTKIYFKDAYGPRVDLSTGGNLLRLMDHVHYGERYADGANIAGGGGGVTTTLDRALWIPVHPRKALRPADFRQDARDYLEGGVITLSTTDATVIGPAAANRFTLNSLTFELWAWVLDEGRRERKSRYCMKDFQITGAEEWFKMGASRLHDGYQYIGQTGENKATPDVWASQTITSDTLELVNTQDTTLQQDYFKKSETRPTAPTVTSDENDPVRAGVLQPVFNASHNQGTSELADVPKDGGLHWRTDLNFGSGTFNSTNSPKFIAGYIENDPARSQCGVSEDKPEGVVKLADGRVVPNQTRDKKNIVHPGLQKKLPAPVTTGPSSVG